MTIAAVVSRWDPERHAHRLAPAGALLAVTGGCFGGLPGLLVAAVGVGLLLALDRHLAPSEEFVVVGPAGSPEVAAALRLVQAKFRPHATVLVHDPAAPADPLLPQLAAMTNLGGVTLYHCRDFACAAPAVGLSAIETACR